jgi:sialate O-acetylesterase
VPWIRFCALSAAVCWLLVVPLQATADVKLPALIGDNMVLQQGVKARIWGTADPGEQVTVSLGGQQEATRANAHGRWQVMLRPMPAGGPFEMTVSGHNTVTVRNVLVGEVWVCSGQSNMAWTVALSANPLQESEDARYAQIRLFAVKMRAAPDPERDVVGKWAACSPKTVPGFSAVAYFFGRQLHKALGVPVGLIQSCVGGTPAEAWTSMPTLAADPDFSQIVARWSRGPAKPDFITPTYLFNGMIAPLTPYAIRGAIWYQGESNASRAYQYRKLFPAMIRDWRRAWRQGDFPFLFVQLANFMQRAKEPGAPSDWAELREAQMMALSVPNTAMATAVDIGDASDIHPKNKQEVGWRLAQCALVTVYGRKVACYGPVYEGMTIEGNQIRLRFKSAEGGLATRFVFPDGQKAFAIAGQERQFAWGEAKIEGETVVVSSKDIAAPVAVRYAWADNPPCSLYNKAGWPALPFRTDDWPGVTQGKQ